MIGNHVIDYDKFSRYCEPNLVKLDDVCVNIGGNVFYIEKRLFDDFVSATLENDVSARDMLEHIIEKALNNYLTWYEVDSDPIGD